MSVWTLSATAASTKVQDISGDSTTYATARTTGSTVHTGHGASRVWLGQWYESAGAVYHCYEPMVRFDASALAGAITYQRLEVGVTNIFDSVGQAYEVREYNWGNTYEVADYVSGADLGTLPLLGSLNRTAVAVAPNNGFGCNLSGTATTFSNELRLLLNENRHRTGDPPTTGASGDDETITFDEATAQWTLTVEDESPFGLPVVLGTANTPKSSGTSISLTSPRNVPAGAYVLVAVAKDNTSTPAGDNSEISSISVGSNNWTAASNKLREYTMAGNAGATVTVSLWGGILASALTTSSTIVANFAAATTAKVLLAVEVALDANVTAVTVAGSAADGQASTVPSLSVTGLTNGTQYLCAAVTGQENNTATGTSFAPSFQAAANTATSGGGAASNIGGILYAAQSGAITQTTFGGTNVGADNSAVLVALGATMQSGQTFQQSAAGTITPAGAQTRRTGKRAAGTVTPAGSLGRVVIRAVAGTVTPAGVVTTAGQTFPRTLAGRIAPKVGQREWDDPAFHPNAFETVNVNDYADVAALLTALASKFPTADGTQSDSFSIDSTNQFEGGNTLRLTRQATDQNYSRMVTGLSLGRLWMRAWIRLTSDTIDHQLRVGPGRFESGGALFNRGVGAWLFTPSGPPVAHAPPQDQFFSVIVMIDSSGERRAWANGTLVVRTGDVWAGGTIDRAGFYVSIGSTVASGGLWNLARWEAVNGDTYPDPFNLLSRGFSGSAARSVAVGRSLGGRIGPAPASFTPHDSATPHPSALEVVDFGDYATAAAMWSDVSSRFPNNHTFDSGRVTISTSEQFNGRNTLRSDRTDGGNLNLLEANKSITGRTKLWMRYWVKGALTTHASNSWFYYGYMYGSGLWLGPYYSKYANGTDGAWGNNQDDVGFPAASMLGAWRNVVVYHNGDGTASMWVDGQMLTDRMAMGPFALLNEIAVWSQIARGETHVAFVEWVDGDAIADPYGLLGRGFGGALAKRDNKLVGGVIAPPSLQGPNLIAEPLDLSLWSGGSTTRTGGQSDPDGGNNAWLLEEQIPGNGSYLYWYLSSAVTPRGLRLRVKNDDSPRTGLFLYDAHTGLNPVSSYIDWTGPTPTFGPITQGSGYWITRNLGGGWYEVELIADTVDPTHDHWIAFWPSNGVSGTGIYAYKAESAEVVGTGFGGALAKRDNKLLAGTITPAGALSRRVAKLLAGTITPAGTVARVKSVVRAVAGTITPAGTLAKRAAKFLGGTITPAGALARVKQAIKAVGGTITPAGSLARRTDKNLAGTITPTGDVTPLTSPQVAVGGTVAPVGNLSRRTDKLLGGGLTPTGADTKRTDKLLGGTLTPSGNVMPATSPEVFTGGNITPQGTLTRRVSKLLAGTLGLAGAVRSVTSKAFSGVIAPVGAVTTRIDKFLSGLLNPSGSVSSTTGAQVNVGGTITPQGSVFKRITRWLSGVLGLSGSVTASGGTVVLDPCDPSPSVDMMACDPAPDAGLTMIDPAPDSLLDPCD